MINKLPKQFLIHFLAIETNSKLMESPFKFNNWSTTNIVFIENEIKTRMSLWQK